MTNLELVDYHLSVLQAFHPNIQPMEGYEHMTHVCWMLYQMKTMITRKEDGTIDYTSALKFNRWLGFVQGAMWMDGIVTIEDLRNQTRDMTYS